MVGRVGIEPTKAKPKDLQSSPFDHSGTDPYITARHSKFWWRMEPPIRLELMTAGLQNRCSTNWAKVACAVLYKKWLSCQNFFVQSLYDYSTCCHWWLQTLLDCGRRIREENTKIYHDQATQANCSYKSWVYTSQRDPHYYRYTHKNEVIYLSPRWARYIDLNTWARRYHRILSDAVRVPYIRDWGELWSRSGALCSDTPQDAPYIRSHPPTLTCSPHRHRTDL